MPSIVGAHVAAVRGAAPAAPAGGGPSSLEYSQNVVTDPPGRRFEISACGCDCWYCSDCCVRKGRRLRDELVPVLQTFAGLMMLTLTIDPSLFASPKAAYDHVREHRGISRLIRELDRGGHLRSRRYFCVLEFQERTEQAHFHILVDAVHIPKRAIDAAWSKLRPEAAGPPLPDRPAFGMTRFSRPKFASPLHAARYATKYLVKTPSHGWPSWVLAEGTGRRIPRYTTSRGFWNRPRVVSTPTGKTRESKPRTYAERIADCGSSCNIFEHLDTANPTTGEVLTRRDWLARVDAPRDVIEVLAERPGSGVRRTALVATTPRGCVEAIQAAAGRPVHVLTGFGARRGLGVIAQRDELDDLAESLSPSVDEGSGGAGS